MESRERAGSRMALFGNLNNPTLLYGGTRDQVYQACWELMDAGVDGIAPEGSVPLGTKKETLQAMAQATQDWSKLHRGDGEFVRRVEAGSGGGGGGEPSR
jgi:uroporphyrinogen-III decarboxylase